jgi:amino-acid N-acetyltransferase
MSLAIRAATANDQNAIVGLVHSERLNPHGLDWSNFVVAVDGQALVGAAQIRRHKDGSRELGSLVVDRSYRRRGLASRLIDTLLATEAGRVLVITGKMRAAYFTRWGFRPTTSWRAPTSIRTNYYLGYMIGGLFALLRRRPVNHLVILDRMPLSAAE